MLATTATTAAAKVPSRYSQRIGRIWVSWPWRWLAIEAITRMNTSTGATAFRALTNTLPGSQVAGHGGRQQGQGDAGEQADDDLRHQAGAVEEAKNRGHVQRNLGM
jgi:hypothetical protein